MCAGGRAGRSLLPKRVITRFPARPHCGSDPLPRFCVKRLRGVLAGGTDGWIFLLRKARKGTESTEREARRQDTECVSDWTVLSPTRRKRFPFVVRSQRAKNLNRTHLCLTSVAGLFLNTEAQRHRGTERLTVPFTLFNQSAADLGFFAIVKGGHLNIVD